nr:protein enhanced downy mildew 2-like [Tanacetum cinerariifolium]
MSSSSEEEEGEIITNSVTNYHFVNHRDVPITFTDLPLHLTSTTTDTSSAFLIGTTDNGLQSVYIPVIGWKYDLSYFSPEVYVAKKTKKAKTESVKWIRLPMFADVCVHLTISLSQGSSTITPDRNGRYRFRTQRNFIKQIS